VWEGGGAPLFSFQPRRFDLAYNGIPMDALRD